MKKFWYSKKEIGKNLYPNKKHPDYKRDKLNVKGMKKLIKLDSQKPFESYLKVGSRIQILLRIILIPYKWKLSLISPSSKGGEKEVKKWQFIAEERKGKIRHMVLQNNLVRNRLLKRI